jgi:hypothetical protein
MGRDIALPDVIVERTLTVEAGTRDQGRKLRNVVVLAAVRAGDVIGFAGDRLLIRAPASRASETCEFHAFSPPRTSVLRIIVFLHRSGMGRNTYLSKRFHRLVTGIDFDTTSKRRKPAE